VDRRLIIIGVSAAVLAAVVAGVLIARGGDDSSSASTEAVSTDLSEKPTPAIPDEAPPAELQSEDIVEGEGAEAKSGDEVTVQYVGVDYETGEEFDTSWDSEPFTFKLGTGAVIPGWDQGVEGMKEGGRRQLVIPPDLAYGPQGQPPAIGPNATLVFVIDLVKVG
jgi:peptidylprolyl isomerase